MLRKGVDSENMLQVPWDTFQDDDEEDDANDEEDQNASRVASIPHDLGTCGDHVPSRLLMRPFVSCEEEQELDEDGNVVPNQAS